MSLVVVEPCPVYSSQTATGGSGAAATHTPAAVHHRAFCHRFTSTSFPVCGASTVDYPILRVVVGNDVARPVRHMCVATGSTRTAASTLDGHEQHAPSRHRDEGARQHGTTGTVSGMVGASVLCSICVHARSHPATQIAELAESITRQSDVWRNQDRQPDTGHDQRDRSGCAVDPCRF